MIKSYLTIVLYYIYLHISNILIIKKLYMPLTIY